jgi:benzoyl-CoA reductase subunit D
MISAGIDIGARNVKVVVIERLGCGVGSSPGVGGAKLEDDVVIGRALRLAGFDPAGAAREAMKVALGEAGASRDDVARVVATGAGREAAPDQDGSLTEVGCAARAAIGLDPSIRAVVDVGAEEARAIVIDARGKVTDYAINEKCATGAGTFTEVVARALECEIWEIGPLSLSSTEAIAINAQCAVFAESEIVSMIHANVARSDIARAVHDAMASRIISMLRKVGYRPPVMLVGGVAHNVGFVDSLARGLDPGSVSVPEYPDYCVALGAARVGADGEPG